MSGYLDDDINPNYHPEEWKDVLEWDKPLVGLYSDGAIRVITSRNKIDGRIGSCTAAGEKDLQRLEHIYGVKFSPDEWALAIHRDDRL